MFIVGMRVMDKSLYPSVIQPLLQRQGVHFTYRVTHHVVFTCGEASRSKDHQMSVGGGGGVVVLFSPGKIVQKLDDQGGGVVWTFMKKVSEE